MIFKLLDEPINREKVLGCWAKHLGSYTKVFGYSATGAIFLMAPETNEFSVFYPSMPGNNAKNYGEFDSIQDFEAKILNDDGFPDYGLYPIKPDDLIELENKLGKLDNDQIYYPKLDPALGGSLELDGFGKGDIWVRTEILGQNRGIE